MPASSETTGLRDALQERTPVIAASGHCRSNEATDAWLRPLLRRVPISRITNVTPIDDVGIPVWSATTPLAKDLTVHAGKGRTSLASRISAIMEAIERVCAEGVAAEHIVVRSYDELVRAEPRGSVLDPILCDLPFETTYRSDRPISWVAGYDLLADADVWVAADLVLSPPCEAVCCGVETTGLAAGNTITEAVLHALYEVIERDALAAESFTHMHCEATDADATPLRLLDPATAPGAAHPFIAQLTGRGLTVRIQDLTSDLDVPVFGALVVDSDFPGAEGEPVTFAGYGADLDPERALVRALTEAAQGHAIVLLGARDTFEGTRALPDRTAMLLRRAALHHRTPFAPFPVRAKAPSDLAQQLEIVTARLRARGFVRVAVADLTREDLDVPVVRVIVPGLALPYGASSRRPGSRLLARIL